MRLGYVVHDLGDAAVRRRVRMLEAGGAGVRLAGFRRGDAIPRELAAKGALDLGRTRDAALMSRALSVGRAWAGRRRLAAALSDADVLMARNLECLALAHAVADGRPVLYECLDIHRMLTGASPVHRAVQRVEADLVARSAGVVTSSPAFLTHHFDKPPGPPPKSLLVENRLLDLRDAPRARPEPPPGPPWTIGWFGMLRCRRSLAALVGLAARMEGRVEVLIAGRPSPTELPDLGRAADVAPGVTFHGAYVAEDLPALYGRCHFAWAIDFFEAGLNSAWLLPNRLYEAAAHGVTPIALGSVETGRWLVARDAGVIVRDDLRDLDDKMAALDAVGMARLAARTRAIPDDDLIAGPDACAALVADLEALAG